MIKQAVDLDVVTLALYVVEDTGYHVWSDDGPFLGTRAPSEGSPRYGLFLRAANWLVSNDLAEWRTNSDSLTRYIAIFNEDSK